MSRRPDLRPPAACSRALRATAGLALLLAAAAGPVRAADPLRVGSSGDYPPFSEVRPDSQAESGTRYEGFDIALARAYAKERGLALEIVSFRWPELLDALGAERFDVAMSGITVRPERSAAGRFTVPVVESGALVLARQPERWSEIDDLDRTRVRIGVNAGGHLERVARQRLPRATLLAIPDNRAVRRALSDRLVDAVVTDVFEAPVWRRDFEGVEELEVFGPFTLDRKALLVHPGKPELAADLDAWLLARERDGRLALLRREWLGVETSPVATAFGALLAAVDERLALMPMIGAVKRRDGVPLEVPERESLVIDAGVAAALEAAGRLDAPPPPPAAVRRFFRALLEAAKEAQWKATQDPDYAPPEALPDLDAALRPALLRIGERIAAMLVSLPGDLERDAVRSAARTSLRAPYVSGVSRRAIADAITALAGAERPVETAPASLPAR